MRRFKVTFCDSGETSVRYMVVDAADIKTARQEVLAARFRKRQIISIIEVN